MRKEYAVGKGEGKIVLGSVSLENGIMVTTIAGLVWSRAGVLYEVPREYAQVVQIINAQISQDQMAGLAQLAKLELFAYLQEVDKQFFLGLNANYAHVWADIFTDGKTLVPLDEALASGAYRTKIMALVQGVAVWQESIPWRTVNDFVPVPLHSNIWVNSNRELFSIREDGSYLFGKAEN
jgi:hypothetical protein